MARGSLEAFARKELTRDDHVIVEATGNAAAVAEVLAPHVDRVVIANPKQVRMIAPAKIKTDAIDAAVLAKLYSTGFLPEVWETPHFGRSPTIDSIVFCGLEAGELMKRRCPIGSGPLAMPT